MERNSVHQQTDCSFRDLLISDLDQILLIEKKVYTHPWTRGIFEDCLKAGYLARCLISDQVIRGYSWISVIRDEAHLLNLAIDEAYQGRGLGRVLLLDGLNVSRSKGAHTMFLEVRDSNLAAQKLYKSIGFNEVGNRPGYYPMFQGRREDAWVMAKIL